MSRTIACVDTGTRFLYCCTTCYPPIFRGL